MHKKKIDILIMFGIAACISIAASIIKLANAEDLTDMTNIQKKIFPGLFRVGLLLTLGIFVHQGKMWARWVAFVLFGIGGIFTVIISFTRLYPAHYFVPVLLLGVFYFGSAIYLVFIRKWDEISS